MDTLRYMCQYLAEPKKAELCWLPHRMRKKTERMQLNNHSIELIFVVNPSLIQTLTTTGIDCPCYATQLQSNNGELAKGVMAYDTERDKQCRF